MDSCLPGFLTELTGTRVFRGNTYIIHTINRAGDQKGRLSLSFDGWHLPGSLLPLSGETVKLTGSRQRWTNIQYVPHQ